MTDILLQLTPEDSLNRMLGDANNLNYPIYGLKSSTPVVVSDTQTRVTLTARERAGPDDPYRLKGSTEFYYNRLEISDYFNGLLDNFSPTLPSSSQALLDEITRLTGIEFETRDFEHIHITRQNADSFKLKAKSESLRWVGEIELSFGSYMNLSSLPFDTVHYDTNPDPFRSLQMQNPFVNITYLQNGFFNTPDDYLPPVNTPFQNLGNYNSLNFLKVPFSHFGVDITNSTTNSTPAPINFYNALVVDYEATPPFNPFTVWSDEIKYAIHIRVDTDYFLATTDPDFYFYYAKAPLNKIDWAKGVPIRYQGLSGLDGSAFSSYFHALMTDTYIVNSPINAGIPSNTAFSLESQQLYSNGGQHWNCINAVSSKNLYMAFVRYNGPKRIQDNSSIDPSLTHVAELILHYQYCSDPVGNVKIYYT